MRNRRRSVRWNTMRILAAGFLGVIFLGGVLLWLPVSNQQPIAFIDALFTSTTAVCVTGLITITPATQFTLFGKIVLMLLIQIGGLGVVACMASFFFLLRKRITVKERIVIQETYNMDRLGGIVGLVKKVIIGTFVVEGAGALFYAFQFVPEYGLIKGLGYSIFHAISAFCNAGIDILGTTSLSVYSANPLVNLTTMALIVLGGLGFVVWFDVLHMIRLTLKRRQSPVSGVVGAYATAYIGGIITPSDLTAGMQHDFTQWFLWMGIIKSLFFAFIIASVSSFYGYTVEGGSINVGKASTNAVVSSSMLILFSDMFLTQLLSA